MKPQAIVRRARENMVDVIGICDHNSTRNVEAVREAGRREGLAVIGGIEIASEEEVHILGLFDKEESLRDMQRLIDQNLQGENNAEFFGEQHVCDEHDAMLDCETKLLIGATTMSIEKVVESIHYLGGLAIASHVDRESFSLLGNLGFVPEGLKIDALEVSPRHSTAEARDSFPETRDYPLVRFSDAHKLADIGMAVTTFIGASPCVSELGKALLGEEGRRIVN